MLSDRDIQAISAVLEHMKLSHNDVILPPRGSRPARSVPVECVFAYCSCEWAGSEALVETPWGLFLLTPTKDGGFSVGS